MTKKEPKTILERVGNIADTFLTDKGVDRNKFISEIVDLIERAKSPDMFCASCDIRMSVDLEKGVLSCFNCGNKVSLNIANNPTVNVSTAIKPTGTPDKKLLNAIDNAEKKAVPKPSSIADKIRKLADSRGNSEPTKEDEDALKNSVPQLKGRKKADINWC